MTSNYDVEERRSQKMASDDRIILIRPVEGKTPRDVSGKTDPRLFSGDNQLHAVYSEGTGMWSLKYDSGAVPAALKQSFVTFNDALKTTQDYFTKRDIEVTGVIHT